MLVRRWRLIGLALLLVSVVSGCGNSPPAPAVTIEAAPLPAGWQQVALPTGSIALPADWGAVSAQDTDFSSAIGDAVAQNPQLEGILARGQAELANGSIQLIAFDLQADEQDESAYPTNLRLGKQSYPSAPTLNAVSDANEQDLRATAGFSDVQRTPVQLADQSATRLTSKLTINNAVGDPLVLAVEQYVIVLNTNVYLLTFSTAETNQANNRAVYDQILATLRFDPAG